MVHTPAVFQPSYIYSHVTRYITFFNFPSPFTFHFHSICPSVHLFCSPQHFPQIPFALAQKVPVPLLFHRPLDCPSDLTFELFQVVPKLFGGINVGRWIDIGGRQHGHHGHQNGFNTNDGAPAFRRRFKFIVFVFSGWVKDRDAYFAVGVDCFCFVEMTRGRIIF